MKSAAKHLCKSQLLRFWGIREILDFAERSALESRQGKLIFFASMPKSGSTFISRKAAEYLNARFCHVADLPGGCEFDIYRPKLIEHSRETLVVQQHTLGTEGNVEYLERYRAVTFVTVRRIDEALLSFHRHLVTESLRWPFVFIPPEYRDWPPVRQMDFLVNMVAPWMVNFVATWKTVESKGSLATSLFFLHFDQLKESSAQTLSYVVLKIAGENADMQHLRQVLEQDQHSYRRRRSIESSHVELSSEHRERLTSLIDQYSDLDLSMLRPHLCTTTRVS